MKVNQAAFDAGQLAERLSHGYYAHLAATVVATDPRSVQLAPPVLPGQLVPTLIVARKDGTAHVFHFVHFLGLAASDTVIADELKRVWITGSLLRLGDVLAQNQYFDRAPELELVRHLRNGIAHGNRFRIDNLANFANFPAHNRSAWVKSDSKAMFEITPSLQGKAVLFNYMEAGDVLDLLMSVGIYLIRMGNGDPLRP